MRKCTQMAIAIATLALLLRLSLVNFAIGFQMDEPIVGTLSQRAVDQGTFSANWDGFQPNPWSRPTYQFSPYTLLQSVIAKVTNWLTTWPTGLPGYILLARICSTVWGVAAVLMVYFLGRLCLSEGAALLGEATLAVCFLAIQDSIYARVDSFLCLMVFLSLTLGIQSLKNPGAMRWFLAACLTIGITIATKYNALPVLILIPFITFYWKRDDKITKQRAASLLALGLLTVLAGFIIATPEILWRPEPLWAGVQYESHHYAGGQVPFQAHDWSDNNLFFWVKYLGELGFGWLPLVFMLVFIARIRRRGELLLGIFLVMNLLIICGTKTRFERNLEICLGVMALASASAAWDLWCWLKGRTTQRVWVAGLLLVLWFGQPALAFYRFYKVVHAPSWLAALAPQLTTSSIKPGRMLFVPGYDQPLPLDLTEYDQIILKDFGDPFSSDYVPQWERIIGRKPVAVWESSWAEHYPFSTVNIFHAPRRVMVFDLSNKK